MEANPMRLIDADDLIQTLAVAFDTFDPRFLRDRSIREGIRLAKKAIEEAKPINTEDSMTASHSEAAILRGCIALMQRLMGRFEDYLDFIDVHPDDEERFCTEFYMTEIVERLFLWETHHSGGTSQHMKLAALGVDAETVTFEDSRETEAEEATEGEANGD